MSSTLKTWDGFQDLTMHTDMDVQPVYKQPLHQQIYNLEDNPEDWLDKQVFVRKQVFLWRSRTTLTKKVQRNDHRQYLAYCPWSSTILPQSATNHILEHTHEESLAGILSLIN